MANYVEMMVTKFGWPQCYIFFTKISLLIQMPLRTDAHVTLEQNKFVNISLQNKEGR